MKKRRKSMKRLGAADMTERLFGGDWFWPALVAVGLVVGVGYLTGKLGNTEGK